MIFHSLPMTYTDGERERLPARAIYGIECDRQLEQPRNSLLRKREGNPPNPRNRRTAPEPDSPEGTLPPRWVQTRKRFRPDSPGGTLTPTHGALGDWDKAKRPNASFSGVAFSSSRFPILYAGEAACRHPLSLTLSLCLS